MRFLRDLRSSAAAVDWASAYSVGNKVSLRLRTRAAPAAFSFLLVLPSRDECTVGSAPGHSHHSTHTGCRHGGHGDGVRGGKELQPSAAGSVPHHQALARHQGKD